MALDIVIGGQRGDEGKGLIDAFLGLHGDYSISIRSASPQAGHSISIDGKRIGLVHVPCASINKNLRILLGAASFIDTRKLLYGGEDYRPHTGERIQIQPEITTLGLNPERLGIDYRAKLVTAEHIARERADENLKKLGSVLSGVNMAKHDLVDKKAVFMTSDPNLAQYRTDTFDEMSIALDKGKHILYETDHGMSLCQHFGAFPYNTARTINTSAYLGEIGIAPRHVRDVYLIIKPYISAVAKNAPIPGEITDEKVLDELVKVGGETGSVSGRARKIYKFNVSEFIQGIRLSGATKIAVSHLDISKRVWNSLGFKDDSQFLDYLNDTSRRTTERPELCLGSYGPRVEDVRILK